MKGFFIFKEEIRMEETNKQTLPTKYDHKMVEKNRYEYWVKEKFFTPSGDENREPFSIVIPPPNVTGRLHLGHAWDTTMQDTISRMKRMQGYDGLWLPGIDHAGIATQAVVEAQLRKEGKTRYDSGREKCLYEVRNCKDKDAHFILSQWKKLGIDHDYSR